ncbi:MAG: tRNA epoxyqueuosine(34) reductase QueG [Acidobacteria bacterium]|nr:tRNA epoxyqueuosine(34) reductase QueG [Acidobacteriota bacterium]
MIGNVKDLAAKIRGFALELGIDKIGFAKPETLAGEGKDLRQWLSKGFHGEMAWMERDPEKRSDPKLIFPEAKSLIVAAVNYFTPYEHTGSESHGKISRYAWGDDYHEIVKAKLAALLYRIKVERPDAQGKICVDTSPIMDKAWAVRAGLGWLGKHSNVISPDIGSWFFIGEILLDFELTYDDQPIADHCGTCTACIDACPTAAIVEPYVVDSRKCISYGTIELRDEKLPDDIAANLNGWLYGCDICQDVCPWNRFEKPSSEPGFAPRNDATSLDLQQLESMEPAAYAERFRRSAIKRTKLGGLKRNAAALRSRS